MRDQLHAYFAQRDDIPLYHIESGSRLWGIASPDSDYDMRGFHLPSKAAYYDYRKHRDLIEVLDGDFDLVSYTVDKMFGLLAKSNPTTIEWLRAHIVYLNALPDFETFQREVLSMVDYRALYHHYRSIAYSQFKLMESGRLFTYKKAFYCFRAILSAQVARRRELPALDVETLFAQLWHRVHESRGSTSIIELAQQSLARKRAATEKQEVVPEEQPRMTQAIYSAFEELEQSAPEASPYRQQLGDYLTGYAIELKDRYY